MVHDEDLIKSLLRGARAIARRIKRSNPEIRIDFESIAEMEVAQVLSTWTEKPEISHKEYVLKKHVNRCVRTGLIEAIEKEKRRAGLWAVSATEFDDEPSEEQAGDRSQEEPPSHGEDMAADGERRYRLRDNSTNPRTNDLSENWAMTDEIGRMRKNINTAPGKITKETLGEVGEEWRKILDALPAHLQKDALVRAEFVDDEMQETLDALLKIERPRLAPPQFQRLKTVVLLELAGFKPKEIAERLGLSKSTIEQALFDAHEAIYHIKARIDNDYRTTTGQLDKKTKAVFMKWRADHGILNPK